MGLHCLKDAASILSKSQRATDTLKLLNAIWKLDHRIEFLTYQELFRDYENFPHTVAEVWRIILGRNRRAAYTCLITLDILSHPSSRYYEPDGLQWSVCKGTLLFSPIPLSLSLPPRSFLLSFIPRTLTYIHPLHSLSSPFPFHPLLSHPSHVR
ncbi:hypothetical protein BDN71DRAFT_285825 [Pleurotus eryngii]|uniref:Uncharacterized protein n=1 Tax=Pleurotus eryngii TaxID=5323 RepID=A0A9P6D3I6_PLEER|nr:hypothetical protein BDN71DRAFT_285825 [Pleurotus eryngii]